MRVLLCASVGWPALNLVLSDAYLNQVLGMTPVGCAPDYNRQIDDAITFALTSETSLNA
jgi:hypothetical protein